MIENPFVTNGYAGAEYFCDRVKETEEIVSLLRNGNNVALISPRRYGKTDLLRHCFEQPNIKQDYYTFIIDIYSTNSLAEMVNQLGQSILSSLKSKGRRTWEHFLNMLSSVRAGINFDISGQPNWNIGIGELKNPDTTLNEIFNYLSNADRRCIVAIDEFQQILKYGDINVEAALRTHVQYCNNANFIFSGSQRHLMGAMFTSPARPFYQSVTIYNLPPLPRDKYTEFCCNHFSRELRELQPEVVGAVYDRFEGVTFYMQRVMNTLFMRTPVGGTCTTSAIDEAVNYIIDFTTATYEDLLYQLPEKQALVLKAISNEGKAEKVTSGAFMKKHHLPSVSSVNSAVKGLLERDLITQNRGVYQVYDKFLDIFLQKKG